MKIKSTLAVAALAAVTSIAQAGTSSLTDDTLHGPTANRFNTRAVPYGTFGLKGGGLGGDLGSQNFSISALMDVDFVLVSRAFQTRDNNVIGYSRFGAQHWNSAVQVPNTAVFIDAPVADWLSAHVSLHPDFFRAGGLTRGYEHRTSNRALNSIVGSAAEGYVTVHREGQPFYLRAGQQHIPFGDNRYNSYDEGYYPVLTSFADILTNQGPQLAVTTGFLHQSGLHASVSVFNSKLSSAQTEVAAINNFSARVGFVGNLSEKMSLDTSIDYLDNVANAVIFSFSPVNAVYPTGTRTGAMSAHATSLLDIGNNQYLDLAVEGVAYLSDKLTGSHPYLIGVDTGITFPLFDRKHRFALGYQVTNNMTLAQLPANVFPRTGLIGRVAKQRIKVDWTTELHKDYVDFAAVLYFDNDYDSSKGGTNRDMQGLITRLSARIA